MQIDAFQFAAATQDANHRISTKIAKEEPFGSNDAYACWQLVVSDVFGKRSQSDSYELLAKLRSAAKHSAESNLYKKANDRQLRSLWQKYKPVLHLAEAAMIAGFADDPELIQLVRRVGIPTDADGVQKRSNYILETLCTQGRIDAPYVVGWE